MADDPRDILRLKRCPECRYDLIGLPHAYKCPECGFAYTEDFFDVRGTPFQYRGPMLVARTFVPLGIGLVMIVTIGWIGLISFSDLIPALLGLAVLGAIVVAMGYTGHDTRDLRLTFTENGILLAVNNGEVMVRPWSAMKSVSVVRLSDSRWRLRIKAPIFSRLIFKYGIKAAHVDRTLDCTDEEAVIVRQELQQRLQRAKSSIDTS